jgi:hypothetical protein
MIDILKRDLRQVRTLAYHHYDTAESTFAENRSWLVVEIDNRQLRQNPVRVEEEFFFPTAAGWEDTVTVLQALDRIEWAIPMKGYDAYLAYNAVNIGRPDTVARLERLVPRLPEPLARRKLGQALDVFRMNLPCISGQTFFHAAHARPADKGTFSNIMAPNWVDPAAPTEAEVMDFLEAAKIRFMDISTVEAELVDGSKLAAQMNVVVHSVAVWAPFERVRTRDKVSDSATEVNPFKNTFTLRLDKKPAAGQENFLEVVNSVPSGPRPVFFTPDTDPELDAWADPNRVPDGYVAVGYKQIWGMKPGYPDSAVQAQPV